MAEKQPCSLTECPVAKFEKELNVVWSKLDNYNAEHKEIVKSVSEIESELKVIGVNMKFVVAGQQDLKREILDKTGEMSGTIASQGFRLTELEHGPAKKISADYNMIRGQVITGLVTTVVVFFATIFGNFVVQNMYHNPVEQKTKVTNSREEINH